MANDDCVSARGGLLPVEYPYGNFRRNYYKLTTGAAGCNIFIGMPMDLDTNGQATVADFSTVDGTALLLGPVVGWTDTTKGGLPNAEFRVDAGPYLPGNTDAYVLIADDPSQLFTIQASTAVAVTTADIGETCTYLYRTGSGSTTTGFCNAEACTFTAQGSAPLQVIGFMDNFNSDGTKNAAGNYCKLRVRIFNHRLGGQAKKDTSV